MLINQVSILQCNVVLISLVVKMGDFVLCWPEEQQYNIQEIPGESPGGIRWGIPQNMVGVDFSFLPYSLQWKLQEQFIMQVQ